MGPQSEAEGEIASPDFLFDLWHKDHKLFCESCLAVLMKHGLNHFRVLSRMRLEMRTWKISRTQSSLLFQVRNGHIYILHVWDTGTPPAGHRPSRPIKHDDHQHAATALSAPTRSVSDVVTSLLQLWAKEKIESRLEPKWPRRCVSVRVCVVCGVWFVCEWCVCVFQFFTITAWSRYWLRSTPVVSWIVTVSVLHGVRDVFSQAHVHST